MQLDLRPMDLALTHTLRLAHGQRDRQETLVVRLSDGRHTGLGEAPASPYYGVTVAGSQAAIEEVRTDVEAWDGDDPAALWESLAVRLGEQRFALSAIDQAAWDLWARRRGAPLHRLWNLDPAAAPPSCITLFIEPIAAMLERLESYRGWPVLKAKLGTPEDLAVVEALRQHSDAVLRVDANGAWEAEGAARLCRALAALDVEHVEQPLAVEDWDGMRRVHAACPIPLVADESCRTEPDVARCAQFFHAVNIKLVKCGGLTPARRMIADARRRGLLVMVGCMTETSVAISAAAQLAPLVDWLDIDGATTFVDDPADGVRLVQGRVVYPDRPGTGALLRAG